MLRKRLLIFITAITSALTGCQAGNSNVTVKEGIYECISSEKSFSRVEIDGEKALFCFSGLSSYIVSGNYTVEQDNLIITDSIMIEDQYVFRIENDELTFVPEESAELPNYDKVDWSNMVYEWSGKQ